MEDISPEIALPAETSSPSDLVSSPKHLENCSPLAEPSVPVSAGAPLVVEGQAETEVEVSLDKEAPLTSNSVEVVPQEHTEVQHTEIQHTEIQHTEIQPPIKEISSVVETQNASIPEDDGLIHSEDGLAQSEEGTETNSTPQKPHSTSTATQVEHSHFGKILLISVKIMLHVA